MGNNTSHRNLFGFEMKFESKFKEVSMSRKRRKFTGKNRTLDFSEICPASSLLHVIARKNGFPVKGDQKFEFQPKRENGLISR
jgi:hypothetical protein